MVKKYFSVTLIILIVAFLVLFIVSLFLIIRDASTPDTSIIKTLAIVSKDLGLYSGFTVAIAAGFIPMIIDSLSNKEEKSRLGEERSTHIKRSFRLQDDGRLVIAEKIKPYLDKLQAKVYAEGRMTPEDFREYAIPYNNSIISNSFQLTRTQIDDLQDIYTNSIELLTYTSTEEYAKQTDSVLHILRLCGEINMRGSIDDRDLVRKQNDKPN